MDTIIGYVIDVVAYVVTLASLLALPLVICLAVLQMFGMIYAPIASTICAAIAYRRHLHIIRYAVIGLIYSSLFFIPWLYLVKRMRQDDFSSSTIRSAYQILFASWGGVLCAYIYIIYQMIVYGYDDNGSTMPGTVMIFSLATLIASAVTFLVSGVVLIRAAQEQQNDSEISRDIITIPLPYLMPLVFLFVWILLSWLMIHLALCWILGSCLLDFVCVVDPLCYSSLTYSDY